MVSRAVFIGVCAVYSVGLFRRFRCLECSWNGTLKQRRTDIQVFVVRNDLVGLIGSCWLAVALVYVPVCLL